MCKDTDLTKDPDMERFIWILPCGDLCCTVRWACPPFVSLFVLFPATALCSDGNIYMKKKNHHLAATFVPRCSRLLAPVAFSTRDTPIICVCDSMTDAFCVVYTIGLLPSNTRPTMVLNELVP